MKIENLDLYALKYFFDSVECQSLTKAAELNYVTRSAISQSIARLELWAERQLTTHEKKNFRLTNEGVIFYRQMKGSYEAFKQSLNTPLSNAQSLRIGCTASVTDALLLPALRKVNIQDLHLITGTSAQLIQRLQDREINIAIYLGESDPADKNEIVLKSGNFILASKTGQLTSQIITTENRPEVTELNRVLVKKKNASTAKLTVESWSLCAQLSADLGYACLIPDFLLGQKLKKIRLKDFTHPYHVIIKFNSPEKLTDSEAQLLKLLRS